MTYPPPPVPMPDAAPIPAAPRKRGRPPGAKNVATKIAEAAARAALDGITPDGGPASATALTLLQTLYRDARLPIEVRMRAAALAAPLESPRPGTTPPPPKHSEGLARRLDEAWARVGRVPSAPVAEDDMDADAKAEAEAKAAADRAWLTEMLS
ncbi:hypothetical protein [Roseomonas gilardii]|uniref:hypothetical protein n=1 Tax=Roseomonas gilardii TaxID=257708 RepID=UPI0004814B7E|nr:hypothetical protein [Roseomonas gilardii]SUE44296.1 Uncharacterised protein [Roseomonas gilardii subsp. rosea]